MLSTYLIPSTAISGLRLRLPTPHRVSATQTHRQTLTRVTISPVGNCQFVSNMGQWMGFWAYLPLCRSRISELGRRGHEDGMDLDQIDTRGVILAAYILSALSQSS